MNYNIGLYAATVLLLFNFDFSFNLIIINVIFLHSSFICLFVCSFHRFLFIRSFITFFIHSILHSLLFLFIDERLALELELELVDVDGKLFCWALIVIPCVLAYNSFSKPRTITFKTESTL